MSEIRIGDVVARSGEKKTGYLHVSETAVAPVLIPLVVVNGVRPGPTLLITGGVHGPEYSSIEAVMRTIRQTRPADLAGAVVAIPVMNMAGFDAWGPQGGISTPFQNPIDTMNLNRVFPGDPEGTMSYQIAAAFTSKILPNANFYIDCHGGDLNEALAKFVIIHETGDAEKDRIIRNVMAASFDCDYVTLADSRKASTKTAADMGIPSVTAEAGTGGVVVEEATQFIFNGIINVMKRLKLLSGEPSPLRKQPIRRRWNLRCDHGGLAYPLLPLGKRVKKGDKVAEVHSIFGEVLETIESPIDGVVTFRRLPLAICRKMSIIGITPDLELEPPTSPPFP